MSDPGQAVEVAFSKRKQREVLHIELPVPIARLAGRILRQAKSASVEEIALEPLEEGECVRSYREGAWTVALQPPPGVLPRLISHWSPLKPRISPGRTQDLSVGIA